MSDGMTITGLSELRAAAAALPSRFVTLQRAVAEATAKRILAGARERLRAQLKSNRTALIDALAVIEDAPSHTFRVVSSPPRGQSANLPVWVEYGTIKMGARPYMHPSAEAETDRYATESEVAATAVLEELTR